VGGFEKSFFYIDSQFCTWESICCDVQSIRTQKIRGDERRWKTEWFRTVEKRSSNLVSRNMSIFFSLAKS
jgi:hypothetical protein